MAGGSGLIGTSLAEEAAKKGWETEILSRSAKNGSINWSPDEGTIELNGPEAYDAIINLAGTSISDGRWTDDRKKEIYSSRINSANTLFKYLESGKLKTKVYIGSSGIGIYGDRGQQPVTENSPIYNQEDWFIKLVLDWEQAHQQMKSLGIRTILLRTGIVLSTDGGALAEILEKTKLGPLTYFGDGKQVWSWIHIHDIVTMQLFAIEHEEISGIINATAPEPVSNKAFMNSLKKHLHSIKPVMGVPRFALRLVLGEMHRVVFESCRALPMRIQKDGFHFTFNTIDEALQDLLSSGK